MQAAIIALQRAKRKAEERIEVAKLEGKPAPYIGRIDHDISEYDRALAVLAWADSERCKLIHAGL